MTNERRWFWLAISGLFLGLLYLLSPILMPFAVGALLAYLGDPLVDRLETLKLSRGLSVFTVFIGFVIILLLVLLILIPALETQLKAFFSKLPAYIDWGMGTLAPYLKDTLGIDVSLLELDRIKQVFSTHWQKTGGIIRNVLQTVSHSGAVILAFFANLALIPVITFYLLRDWDVMVEHVRDLLPRSIEPTVSALAKESDEVLGAFLRGQLMVMLALAIIYSIGLGLVGVELALLIGFFAGLLSFVPYLGLVIGIAVAGVAVMFQTHDIVDLLLVFLVFGVAQLIEGTVLTPLLVGERIGLHPVAVIFAVLAGGQLFGFFGILLALPVAAVLAVIFRHLHQSYKESHIYKI